MATRTRRKFKTPPRRTGPADPMVDELIDRAARIGLTPFALSRGVKAHPSVLNRWRNGTSPQLRALRPYVEYVEAAERKSDREHRDAAVAK